MVPGTWHFRNMVFQLPFELLGASQILWMTSWFYWFSVRTLVDVGIWMFPKIGVFYPQIIPF